jgi:hypothetical protein
MTNQVTFRTPKGSTVSLAILTETANMADHNVANPCYELVLSVNDQRMAGGVERITHAAHGPALELMVGGAIIPVPAEALNSVDAMVGSYKAEIARRSAIDTRATADYETRHDYIDSRMAE